MNSDKFHIHWDKLRLFHQIAKAGSFNAGAQTLNISQPALSRSIQILEKHLQVRLFERLADGLKLTRQGEILFDSVEKITGELALTQITLESEEKEPVGSLRIAATSGFASHYLTIILPEFLTKYPKIQLSIYCSDILPNLHSDEADAIISPFIKKDASLVQTYLTAFHLKLYASKEYLEKYGTPKSASDLDQHQLLSYGDHKTLHPFSQANWHLTLGLKDGMIRQPYVMVNSAAGLFNLARAGMGIASISMEHPPLKNSSLVEVLPHIKAPTIEAYFIYSTRNKKIKRMELLKQFLLDKFIRSPENGEMTLMTNRGN